MSTTNREICVESALPVVSSNGLNTNMTVDFSNSTAVALPASTTIGGSSVSALGNLTSSSTTVATQTITNTGVFTGVAVFSVTANSATTGTISVVTANALTTGTAMSLVSTGTITTTGSMLSIAANTATSSTGIVRISTTGLTGGSTMLVTGGGANITSGGKVIEVAMGAAITGNGLSIVSTGVYTSAGSGTGLLNVTGNSATTTTGLVQISGTGLTTGTALKIGATSATLTTGFYIACSDGTGNVFTVGSNGHLTSNLGGGTAPVMTTNASGISATAIIAGSTDVAGGFTTTGTPISGTVLTCTFHKTYTTAPKFVVISPLNAAAGNPNTVPYVSSITATTFVLTWPAAGTYAATPSYAYFVVA